MQKIPSTSKIQVGGNNLFFKGTLSRNVKNDDWMEATEELDVKCSKDVFWHKMNAPLK